MKKLPMPVDASRRRQLLGLMAGATVVPSLRASPPGLPPRPWPQGRPTPALALAAHPDGRWQLAQARGKLVMLNFWASWCEPCRSEMPSLELLAAKYEAQGLVVVTVNFRESPAAIDRFLELMPVSLPILRDADGAVAKAWGVGVFPTTIVVGRDGRARFSRVGEVDWNATREQDALAGLLHTPT
jgi:thiol-disulfide isomerase/thioredoxin